MSGDDEAVRKDDKATDRRPDAKSGDNKLAKDDKLDNKPDEEHDDKPHSKLPLVIASVVAVIAIIGFLIYWLATLGQITTDDAYTDGRAISMASNVSGYVTALNINDNTFVKTGELLLTVDPRADQAAVQQAQANPSLAQSQLASAQVDLQQTQVKAPAQLQQAEAQLEQAQAQEIEALRNYRRLHNVDQRATVATDVDQATEQLRSARATVKQAQAQVASASLVPQMIASAQETIAQRQAQVAQAQANLAQAKVKLSYSEITAPQDGTVTMRNVELGTYVQAGQQLFYIVTPQVWVTANFKETQLNHIQIGDRVTMTVDAFPALSLTGHVESMQAGSGARFTAFPAENATGNFVKIVRRVPVKIIIDHGLPPGLNGLPLGISVDPTVYTK